MAIKAIPVFLVIFIIGIKVFVFFWSRGSIVYIVSGTKHTSQQLRLIYLQEPISDTRILLLGFELDN